MKASFLVLGNPFNLKKAKSLTFEQFRYGFANAVPEKEARSLFDRWTIPWPCRPLFQAATVSFAGSETKVNTQNTKQGTLLITRGEYSLIVDHGWQEVVEYLLNWLKKKALTGIFGQICKRLK